MRTIRQQLTIMLLAGLFLGNTGCVNVRTTDPPRTATEQFLLSQAALRAVEQLNFDALRGRSVWVDTTHFASQDAPFVLGEIRSALLVAGGLLPISKDEAQIILEARTPGVGIDRRDFLLGLPAMLLPANSEVGGAPLANVITPEIAILKNNRQDGVAGVAYVAYWKDTGEIVATSGPFIGRSMREDWWILGMKGKTISDIPPAQPTGSP